MGPSHAASTGLAVEDVHTLQSRAHSAWERVVVLVGYFDLDPNRALDIILDIFSANLTTHYEFFLALLSYSPWSGDYQRPKQASQADTMVMDEAPPHYKGKPFDEILRMAEVGCNDDANTSTSDSLKPKVIQQLLGFKFKHYQVCMLSTFSGCSTYNMQSPDVPEHCPKSLYFTTALLIREGFISLEDIYPHVSCFVVVYVHNWLIVI